MSVDAEVLVEPLTARSATEHRTARPAGLEERVGARSRVSASLTVAALTAIAFAVRLPVRRGLWLDELTSVHQARLPLGEMLDLLYGTDNHPPLHHLLLWVQIRLVGDSELALRLPSMVLGALLVPMLYVLGRDLFGRTTGLVAAALGTVAPVVVWYGQEARMYALFMLLAAVATWAQVQILRLGRARHWTLFGVAGVALVMTQYFAVLHVVALHVVFAIAVWQRRRVSRAPDGPPSTPPLLRPWLGTMAAQVMVLAPMVPLALQQFANNQRSGFGFDVTAVASGSAVVPSPSAYTLLTNLVWALWGYQPASTTTLIVALWPLGLLLVLLMLGRRRRQSNRYLLLLVALPTLAMFGMSVVASQSRSLAEVRYFAGAVPMLLVLVAALITTIARRRAARVVLTGLLAGSMVIALVSQATSEQNPRLYGYREAMAAVARDARPGDRLVFTPSYLDYLMEYYSPRVPSAPLRPGSAPDAPGRVILVASLGFADSAQSKAAAIRAAEDLGESRQLAWRRSWPQVTVWVFE